MKPKALRGVNLGGWLIIEKWMTPSLFDGLDAEDERSLSQTEEGRARVRAHRQTFITEDDFAWLAKHNVDLVRIPFGYWLFRDDSNYESGSERLDWAMSMAEKHGIKVLLDLHALPGSQNGHDHSGQIGDVRWFDEPALQVQAREICLDIARRYRNSPALWGFEIINEPLFAWRTQRTLRRYYRRTYRQLVELLPDHIYVVFSDAFRPWVLAGALRDSRRQRVAMDIHWYSSGANWRRYARVSDYYRTVRRRLRSIYWLQKLHPVIVGEWSGMLDKAAAMKLEGRSLHEAENDHLRAQLAVYQHALAHIYWSYKTEHDGAWNYKYLTEKGVFKMTDSATLET